MAYSLVINKTSNTVEKPNLLPEEQLRFRNKRNCRNGVFYLSTSVINIHLRIEVRKVYSIFIDLLKAFDSVPYNKL